MTGSAVQSLTVSEKLLALFSSNRRRVSRSHIPAGGAPADLEPKRGAGTTPVLMTLLGAPSRGRVKKFLQPNVPEPESCDAQPKPEAARHEAHIGIQAILSV